MRGIKGINTNYPIPIAPHSRIIQFLLLPSPNFYHFNNDPNTWVEGLAMLNSYRKLSGSGFWWISIICPPDPSDIYDESLSEEDKINHI